MTEPYASPADWIIPFCDAATEVFLCMLQATCQIQSIRPPDSAPPLESITIAIDLTGTAPGRVILSVAESVADQFVERLTGFGAEGDLGLLRDIVGEVANMVAGSGKGNLPQLGFLIGTPRQLTAEEFINLSANWPLRQTATLETSFGLCLLDVSWNFQFATPSADTPLPEAV